MKTERKKTLKATHPFSLPLLLLPAGATSPSQLLFAKAVAISNHKDLDNLNATVDELRLRLTFSGAYWGYLPQRRVNNSHEIGMKGTSL